jgi:hypothetical protein
MTARKRFYLRNKEQQYLATVITFYDDVLKHEVGFITTCDYKNHLSGLYDNVPDKDIISDLAKRLKIDYHDYIEVKISKEIPKA